MSELEKKIAYYLFEEKKSAEKTAEIVGYSARQIYRIKKKLKEDMLKNG